MILLTIFLLLEGISAMNIIYNNPRTYRQGAQVLVDMVGEKAKVEDNLSSLLSTGSDVEPMFHENKLIGTFWRW